jgi:hypothetical protein
MSYLDVSFELLEKMIIGGVGEIYISNKAFKKMDVDKVAVLFTRYDVKMIQLGDRIKLKYL